MVPLFGANLSGANLSGADLSVDLRDTYLVNADLAGANLSGASLQGAIGIPSQAKLKTSTMGRSPRSKGDSEERSGISTRH